MVNIVFATLYFLAGPEGISGRESGGMISDFVHSFYFSTQTITTVGFGKLSPNSNAVSVIAAIESFMGLLSFAIATGLLFARFSRPRQNIIYSDKAIIAPYKEINALMFRFANKSKNQLIEVEVDVVISFWDNENDKRIFQRVDLERRKINFLSTSWTLVHPITEESPIYGWDADTFDNQQIEIIVMFKAFDDTYVRQIYDRVSYDETEIKWAKKFVPIFDRMDDGMMHIHLERIGDTTDAALN